MSQQVVNGVPVKDMAQLMDAMKSEPEKGQGVYRSVTTWKGGFNCNTQVRDFTVYLDEPEMLPGGRDTAPNMVEAVLAAYGSCLTVGYALNGAMRGIEIKNLSIEVEGDLDLADFLGLSDEVPPGFSKIRARVHLDSDASPEDVQALHEHVLKTSPVGNILKTALPVQTELASG